MMLTAQQLDAIRTNLKAIMPEGDRLATLFFARLFGTHPQLRPMFPLDSYRRAQDLLTATNELVRHAHRLDAIESELVAFGARNDRAGIQPMHYGAAREAMLAALTAVSGEAWNDELHEAWSTLLYVVSSVTLRGAGRARARAA